MKKIVAKAICRYQNCQKHGHRLSPLHSVPILAKRQWEIVEMDCIMGLPETSDGNKAVLVVGDRHTGILRHEQVWKPHQLPLQRFSDKKLNRSLEFRSECTLTMVHTSRMSLEICVSDGDFSVHSMHSALPTESWGRGEDERADICRGLGRRVLQIGIGHW